MMLRDWAPNIHYCTSQKFIKPLLSRQATASARLRLKALAQSHRLVMKLGLAAGNLPDCSLIEPLSQALRDWEPLPKHNNLARGVGFSTQSCTHSGDPLCWAPQMQQHRSPVLSKKHGLKLAQSLLPPEDLLLV